MTNKTLENSFKHIEKLLINFLENGIDLADNLKNVKKKN